MVEVGLGVAEVVRVVLAGLPPFPEPPVEHAVATDATVTTRAR
jgi:hypothetical protein